MFKPLYAMQNAIGMLLVVFAVSKDETGNYDRFQSLLYTPDEPGNSESGYTDTIGMKNDIVKGSKTERQALQSLKQFGEPRKYTEIALPDWVIQLEKVSDGRGGKKLGNPVDDWDTADLETRTLEITVPKRVWARYDGTDNTGEADAYLFSRAAMQYVFRRDAKAKAAEEAGVTETGTETEGTETETPTEPRKKRDSETE